MDHPAPPPLRDPAVLTRLLALAGPEADQLLHQLRADLATACAECHAALAASDALALRRAVHVLVALAGTLGATPLHADLRQLLEEVHATGRIPDRAAALAAAADALHRDLSAP